MNKILAKRLTQGTTLGTLCAALLLFAAVPNAVAQPTDISSIPLTTVANHVKPNLLFILDDSGSMARDYMPDDVNAFGTTRYGRYASQCNGLAYNPSATYSLPVDATGAPLAAGTFTFPLASSLNNVRTITTLPAPSIGTGSFVLTLSTTGTYANGSTVTLYSNDDQSLRMVGTVTAWNGTTRVLTVNVTATQGSGTLTNPRVADGDNRPFYFTYSGGSTPLGYTYNSSGVITTTTFYQECNTSVGSNPSSGATFTKVVVTPTSSDIQRYRDWYTYYRTRLLMAKSATSLAFRPISDRFRVGFTTINSRVVDGSLFLDVDDFDDTTHKPSFYTSLYAATAPSGNFTPLRGALAKAGKYYAKKGRLTDGTTQTYDPVQYSCQKNFAILTTDGYWNTDDEVTGTGANSYGPDRLDNTDVGQQDGTAPRSPHPMQDDANTVEQERTSALQQRTVTPQWTTATSTLQQRTVTGSLQISTSNLQSRTWALFQETSSNSGSTWTAPVSVATCVWDNTGTNRTRCSIAAGWGPWTNAASCTATALDNSGGTWGAGVQCQYTAWTAPVNTASCTAQAQDTTSPHTVGVATQCTPPVYGTWTNTATCDASATLECRYTAPVNTTTTSCTAVAPSAGPNYTVATAVQCTPLTPVYTAWTNTGSCTVSATNECRYNTGSWTNVTSCTAVAQSTAPNYTVGTARECQTVVTSGGTSNTLADVAMYYYNTDLRTTGLSNCTGANGIDVCGNNVSGSGADTATHQHLTSFTVGMGVNGTLGYHPSYLTGLSADYELLKQGTKDWPAPSGSAGAQNIDDLWHAAVNGRGQYFSAGNPAALATGLRDALLAIDALSGSGSGAAASTLQPVADDNSLYIAKYTTVHWTGDLVSRSINPVTGVIASTDNWSAEQTLDARVAAGTARNIYYMQRTAGANSGTLRPFTYTNLQSDGLDGNFDGACSKAVPLSQCIDSGYDVTGANNGANMVNWLRGGYDARYRLRRHVLGDIVGGAPVSVKRPQFQYTENAYASFKAANNSRTGVVYVASNDGMLHAFRGETTTSPTPNPGPGGEELWAYVPTMVMNRMYRLADNDYPNRHQFLANGAPVVGDIYVPPVAPATTGTWKTILVAGLGAGGSGYYALDITNPHSPSVLWEFTNDALGGNGNLGLTFGNPVITKRANGTWVVAFTSGYNNHVSPGDGNGHLFVVNANTGERLAAIATETSPGVPAGTTTTPSGLGKLNGWVDSTIDNTARRFYAGDLLGNVWRFDIDGLVAPNNAAHRLAYLSVGSVAQPITTQLALAEVNYGGSRNAVVYVGTGRLLGDSDLGTTGVQTIYALKDPLDATSLGDARTNTSVVTQTLSETAVNAPRTVTNNAVNWSTDNGWKVDLIGSGERVSVDMQVIFQNLTVATNMPNNSTCGGSSYLYNFNINSGSAPVGITNVGTWLGTSLVVGLSYLTLQLSDNAEAGSGRTITVIVDNRGVPRVDDAPPPPPPPATGRRASWRELVN